MKEEGLNKSRREIFFLSMLAPKVFVSNMWMCMVVFGNFSAMYEDCELYIYYMYLNLYVLYIYFILFFLLALVENEYLMISFSMKVLFEK